MAGQRRPEQAEPLSIGTAGTANVLAREARLLGALLGEIIVEQAGPQLELLRTLRGREAVNPADATLPVIPSIGLTISGSPRPSRRPASTR